MSLYKAERGVEEPKGERVKRPEYTLVTNFWNERGNIEGLMANIAAQSRRPKHWVWIDDGSVNGGSKEVKVIADMFDLPISIYQPVRPKNEGDLMSIGKAWNGVLPSLKALHKADYLAIAAVDDRFPQHYFEFIMDYLDIYPTVGVASGQAKGEKRFRHMPQGGGKVITWAIFEAIEKVWDLAPDTFFNIKAMALGYRPEALSNPLTMMKSAPSTPRVGRKLGRNLHYCGNSIITTLFKTVRLRDLDVLRGHLERRGQEQCEDPDIRYYYSKRRILKSIFRRGI
jgi:hypothetical protein